MIYLFAYDIASDRVRNRVSNLLEDYGVRVQKSVFELRVTKPRSRTLARRIGRLIDQGDSLRVYPIPQRSIFAIEVFGSGLPPEASDFILT